MEDRTIRVRTAEAGEQDAIIAVVREAFTGGGHDGDEEVRLVTATWSAGAAAAELELVALDGEAVAGYVLGGWGRLDDRPVVGIAPLAVAPARQRQGVGTALMREVVHRSDRAGLAVVVVLGDPAYYGRFGFEPAAALGITYPPAGTGPHFQARRLAAWEPSYRGVYRYAWE